MTRYLSLAALVLAALSPLIPGTVLGQEKAPVPATAPA